MNVIDFADALCHLNTVIHRYLNVKKAIDYFKDERLPLPNEIITTIQDVLWEKINQYEKQIIELATKLSAKSEEQPEKKKK